MNNRFFAWMTGAATGAAALGLLGASAAQALTPEEISTKLETVPVFLILNSEGQPLTASASQQDTEVQVPVVFVDGVAAESFLEDARAQDAEAQIALLDLGTVYTETQADSEGPTPLLYFPEADELQAAVSIREDFQGVPLFLARQGEEGPYLTITEGEESSLPMFFSRDDLQALIDRYSQQNPDDAAEITVQVLSLELLLQMMEANDDPQLDEQLSQVRLFPSSDVLNYLRSQQTDESAE